MRGIGDQIGHRVLAGVPPRFVKGMVGVALTQLVCPRIIRVAEAGHYGVEEGTCYVVCVVWLLAYHCGSQETSLLRKASEPFNGLRTKFVHAILSSSQWRSARSFNGSAIGQ